MVYRMMPQSTKLHIDNWIVYDTIKHSLLCRSMYVEGFPRGAQKIRRKFTFWIWRDADFVSSYIDREMKAEFETIREAAREREKFLAMHGGMP